ncbi:Aste57867_15439 [Aphanomyces stellatus]|uniref:Aste57867_15439 protein n=1 Tax=Aphanomyces stellatus TaxID=120398 RepID=A0A485L432_9STRA|nr:hypothetical protein As57867_015383 [Aphanomyces stellatus]VFT92241.1 Aste57867_15439 [Aphanomyces stellatus]
MMSGTRIRILDGGLPSGNLRPPPSPPPHLATLTSTHMTGVEERHQAQVLRVGLEIENIGERVPASKKRLSWRFIFADSEEVHTITLEHSRVSGKKRVKLDGKRIGAAENFTPGPWAFDFTVPAHPLVPFQILIKDLNALGLMERARANLNPDALYSLSAHGVDWEVLANRPLKYESATVSKNRWSSNSYARRVHFAVDRNAQKDARVSWLFTFGQDGAVHQLLLEDCADGSKILVLDRMSLRHDQPTDAALTLDLAPTAADGATWTAQHFIGEDEHELVVRVLQDGRYVLHIDGCAWDDMAETDYVLQPGFYPVHSKSTGKVYYRDDESKQTLWEKPVLPRHPEGSERLPPSSAGKHDDDAGETKPVDLDELVDLMNFDDKPSHPPSSVGNAAPTLRPSSHSGGAPHSPAVVVDLLS